MRLRRAVAGLAVASVAIVAGAAESPTGPLRAWEIDFGDPEEASRWAPYPFDRTGTPIEWEIVPRSPSDRAGPEVLRLASSGGLGVETSARLWRPFPPDFRIDPATETAVLEWEWKIADTEVSDWVAVGLAWTPFDGEFQDFFFPAYSHSRYTKSWRVLFDPPSRWISHRLGGEDLSSWRGESSGRSRLPAGVVLEFHEPVKQVVEIARLRVEAWPRGSVPYPKELSVRRIPPLETRFRESPIESLRNAKGGALEDLDGDGLPELLVLLWRDFAHLYRNRGGRFDGEISGQAGLELSVLGTGGFFADLDGDRDFDLVVTAEYDVPRLYENRGDLSFVERLGLPDRFLGHWYGAAAADLDGDLDLDLAFVGPSPTVEGLPVLRGDRGFRFEPVPWLSRESLPHFGELNFGIVLADLDSDDDADVLLSREVFLRNEGRSLALVPEPWKGHDPTKAEGILTADWTGDGNLDLLVLRDTIESGGRGARLLVGDGAGAFVERTEEAAFPDLRAAEVALAEDFDNDGALDLYICQRHWANHLLLNDGGGTFRDATEPAGMEDAGGCDGAAAADVDGDGGMDVVIFSYGHRPRVLRNRLPRGGWIGIVPRGDGGMADAVGARVVARDRGTGLPISTRWVRRGGGFGSNGPGEVRIGVGEREAVDLEARFPSGTVRRVAGLAAGRTHLVREGGGLMARLDEARSPAVRAYRRLTAERPAIPLSLSALGLALGWGAFRLRRARIPLLAFASFLFVAILPLGWAPGRGPLGFPALLVGGGATLGVLVPLLARAGGRALRRVAKRDLPRPSPEELLRFTQDFRHAGIETRAILSIHARAQNLFLDGSPHPPFLSELRGRALRFESGTGASLDRLVRLAREAYPDLAETETLAEAIGVLGGELASLDRIGDDPSALRRWRDRVLPRLEAVRAGIPALLSEIDRRCGCGVEEVVREVVGHHAERLRAVGVEVSVTREGGDGELRAVIAREDLFLVLENLLSNALDALDGRMGGRIVLRLRRDASRIVLECEDDGSGVPPDLRERIFEYGFTTRRGGRGYGLARSREILGHYGGGLRLEEGVEVRGARFVVTMRGGEVGHQR